MKYTPFILLVFLMAIIPSVSAEVNNATIVTTVINTPYLDMTIWVFIVLLGLGFMILSNITTKDQNNALWALISPFFMWPSAYFATMIQTMSYVPVADANNIVHITIQQTVFHPEWLAIVLGIISLFSTINVYYILTKKPFERESRDNIYGGSRKIDSE